MTALIIRDDAGDSHRERLELFHSAFEQSTDAIIITGLHGKIIDVNGVFIAHRHDRRRSRVFSRQFTNFTFDAELEQERSKLVYQRLDDPFDFEDAHG